MNSNQEPGTITVNQTYTKGKVVTKETDDATPIDVGVFHTDTARVSYTQQMTLNMGSYESVKVGVTCTLPAYVEEIDEALVTAKEFVNEKLSVEVTKIKEYRAKKKGS